MSTGQAKKLRWQVRLLLVSYARTHPESFPAHMVASSVQWLLAGREGVSVDAQQQLANAAHTYISKLDSHIEADEIKTAHTLIHDLMKLIAVRLIQETETQPKEGDMAPEDFMAWMSSEWEQEKS